MTMKNILLISWLALVVLACQPQLKEGEFLIKGSVKGMDVGSLFTYWNNQPDTIQVVNGTFEYRNESNGPGRFSLAKSTNGNMDAKTSKMFYIQPGVMELTVDYQDMSKSILSGSTAQDQAEKLERLRDKVTLKYQTDIDIHTSYRAKLDAAYPTADEATREEMKYKENELKAYQQPMYEELRKVQARFIKENPNAYVSVETMRFMIGSMPYAESNALFEGLSQELKNTEMGMDVAKELEDIKSGSPGSPATQFTAEDINGETLSLASYKGQYVLLDFWASWCVPCRAGNPHLISLYNKYQSKGFEIIGVADDTSNKPAWHKAVDKDKIGIWKHVLRGAYFDRQTRQFNTENDITIGYGISSLPTKILIDPEGMIIGRFGAGGGTDKDMDRMLEEIFGS